MLLCLLYVLRATDCHAENLIACGEHPVLVDMETLLHHDTNPLDRLSESLWNQRSLHDKLGASVLRCGLLPRWEISADRRDAYDVSGLGSSTFQQMRMKAPHWRQVNSETTSPPSGPCGGAVGKNLPYTRQRVLSLVDYETEFCMASSKCTISCSHTEMSLSYLEVRSNHCIIRRLAFFCVVRRFTERYKTKASLQNI
jgi:lantibiotic modifying enzyme